MTKQSKENKPQERNTKASKKHDTQKINKKPKLIQKDYYAMQLIDRPLDNEHRYFIRGGIMIDFKLLKYNWKGED